MMSPEELVLTQLTQCGITAESLPQPLQEALSRHCVSLMALVASLQMVGKDVETIGHLVRDLLTSYEVDMVKALERSE